MAWARAYPGRSDSVRSGKSWVAGPGLSHGMPPQERCRGARRSGLLSSAGEQVFVTGAETRGLELSDAGVFRDRSLGSGRRRGKPPGLMPSRSWHTGASAASCVL